MADQANSGQFGMRQDTQEEAKRGGEASGINRAGKAHKASGAAGKTEAARRGGKHSHRSTRRIQ